MLGRRESIFGSIAPGHGTDFSSLYRGENFLRSGAENPPLDLPRLGVEQIFSLYRGETFLRSGAHGESMFLLYMEEKITLTLIWKKIRRISLKLESIVTFIILKHRILRDPYYRPIDLFCILDN